MQATVYNAKAEAIFDFGTGPKNAVHYSPHGNLLVLAGFGNLRGGIDVWDTSASRKMVKPSHFSFNISLMLLVVDFLVHGS